MVARLPNITRHYDVTYVLSRNLVPRRLPSGLRVKAVPIIVSRTEPIAITTVPRGRGGGGEGGWEEGDKS